MADTPSTRERFEAWAKPRGPGLRFDCDADGLYLDGDTDDMFHAYQAAESRASVLVEALEKAHEFIETVHEGEYGYSKCTRDEFIDQLDAAIRSYKEGEGNPGVPVIPNDQQQEPNHG